LKAADMALAYHCTSRNWDHGFESLWKHGCMGCGGEVQFGALAPPWDF